MMQLEVDPKFYQAARGRARGVKDLGAAWDRVTAEAVKLGATMPLDRPMTPERFSNLVQAMLVNAHPKQRKQWSMMQIVAMGWAFLAGMKAGKKSLPASSAKAKAKPAKRKPRTVKVTPEVRWLLMAEAARSGRCPVCGSTPNP